MWAWILGIYTHDAVSVALHNNLSKKGTKPIKYMEKQLYTNRELTKEDKKKKLELLFGQLEVRKTNFNLTHGDKQCRT